MHDLTITSTPDTPDQRTRKAEASLPPSMQQSLQTAMQFDREYNLIGMRPLDLSPDSARAALNHLAPLYEPASFEALAKSIGALFTLTKARHKGDADMQFSISLYAQELRKFPGDLALQALERWPHQTDGKWWPALAELIALMDDLGNKRRRLTRDALERACNPVRPGTFGIRRISEETAA